MNNALALAFALSAVLAGCGGDPSTPTSAVADSSAPNKQSKSGCLDPTDGANSAFHGSKGIGQSCDTSAPQSECQSGLCINDGSGTGFCTSTCSSDGACGSLVCKSFTQQGTSYSYCISSSKIWCSN